MNTENIQDGWYVTKFISGDTLILKINNGIDEAGFDIQQLIREGIITSIQRIAVLTEKTYLRLQSLIDFEVELY